MPHVPVANNHGIRGLLEGFPVTGAPLRALAEALLVAPSSLSRGERELIATFVSSRNECHYCTESHAAAARALGEPRVVDAVLAGDVGAAGPRMRVLLEIAEQVRSSVAPLDDALVRAARGEGADDSAIHDTVLIAAAFCMFNRYVEGLHVESPRGADAFIAAGQLIAEKGYVRR